MGDQHRRFRGLLFNTIVSILGLGAAVYLVWSLRPLFLPIIIGVLLAYLFRPIKSAFKYRWLPNGIRVALIFTVLTGGVLVLGRFVQTNIPNEKEKLEIMVRLRYKFNEKFTKMMEIDPVTGKGNSFYNLIAKDINPMRQSLNSHLELSPEQKESFQAFYEGVDGFEPVPEKYYEYFLGGAERREPAAAKIEGSKSGKKAPPVDKNPPPAEEQSIVRTVISVLSIWFLLPIVFVFFLLDDGDIPKFFVLLVPNRYFELTLTVLEEVDSAIGKYLRGISLECGLVGITMAVGLFAVGVPLKIALLIGILAGVATAIPLVGPVVGLSFGLTYALIAEEVTPLLPMVTLDNLFLAVLIVNGIVIVLDNIVFQPIVLGSAVNLHPLVVILGIMGASMLFGMAGVLLAIPTIVVTKAIIQHMFRGLRDYRII